MDYYGIDLKGPLYGERVSTLPVWSSSDEGREIYCLDTGKRYFGSDTEWVEYIKPVDIENFVDNDFVANSILKANVIQTPVALSVAENRIIGRLLGGLITDLTAAQVRTMINVEDGADVTDETNVAAAGAVMESDTTTASMSFVIDEDNMTSNLSTKVPTQQSVKAYSDLRLVKANNLSDVASDSTAFDNIKQDATIAYTGVVELAEDSESAAGKVVQSNDSRLKRITISESFPSDGDNGDIWYQYT